MTNLLESTEIFEGLQEWTPFYEQLPIGTIYYKVKCYGGDGNYYGADYTLDRNNIESMQLSVADEYYTDTVKCTKK
jgi:hypothetical protein